VNVLLQKVHTFWVFGGEENGGWSVGLIGFVPKQYNLST